jgi:hypothetical protein
MNFNEISIAFVMIKHLDPIRVNSKKPVEAAVKLQPNGVAFISVLNYIKPSE